MSPEQVRGAKADARSDVFALGCVLLRDAHRAQALRRRVHARGPLQGHAGGAVPLREAAPGTPEALVQVVERSLAKNPAERFENAGEMLAGIRQARQAVAAGKGHERVPGLDRPPAGPVAREAGRPPARERSHPSAVPRGTVPPSTAAGSRWPLLVGLGLAARGRVGRRLGIAGVRAEPAGRAAAPARRGQPARAAGDRLAGRARSPEARSRRAGRRRAAGGGRPEARRAQRGGAAGPGRGRRHAPADRRGRGRDPRGRAWTANVSRARPST